MFTLIRVYWWQISLLALVLITGVSLYPAEQLPHVPGSDKTHHFIAYGLLALPVALARPRYWWAIVVGYVFYGGLIELVQPMVNRYGEWLDLVANSFGVLLGVAVATLVNLLWPQHASTNKV